MASFLGTEGIIGQRLNPHMCNDTHDATILLETANAIVQDNPISRGPSKHASESSKRSTTYNKVVSCHTIPSRLDLTALEVVQGGNVHSPQPSTFRLFKRRIHIHTYGYVAAHRRLVLCHLPRYTNPKRGDLRLRYSFWEKMW
jgi:hypothetical protein